MGKKNIEKIPEFTRATTTTTTRVGVELLTVTAVLRKLESDELESRELILHAPRIIPYIS